uniref:uncharacterized protein LOC109967772 n=1 Tax=Monopterus albus TaxID=43700 RepID=UPI0009B4396F|nr:uncharacterized protein LOC109967772 [Monopterus albus]
MDMSAQHLQVLRDKYKSELQAQDYTNLLQLLISDAPLTSGFVPTPCPHLIENSSSEQMATEFFCSVPGEAQNISDRSAKALTADSVRVQAADGTDKQDICAGCGVVMEELPYLEILYVSEASNTHQNLAAERGAQEEEEGSTTKSPKSYEKQGSLIPLAWSKPPDNDIDCDAKSADGDTGQRQDGDSSVEIQGQLSDKSSTAEHTQHDEALKPTLLPAGSPVHHIAQSAGQQYGTGAQLTLEERPVVDQPQKGEVVSESDRQIHALVAERPQAVQLHLSVDPPEIKSHTDDLCSGLANEAADVGRDGADAGIWPATKESELRDLSRPGPAHAENQEYNSQAGVDYGLTKRGAMRESTLIEREQVREPVSAMERERTMRNLVDMQRKVEQRQQRARERQLLRIQERLSIIRNRKAEEDLLGLKHTDRLKHLTQNLPQEDKNQQKTVVRERLEQLKRERSYVMQSKRDRNTAGFKELLGPVALHSREREDETE